jgi:hypothetical protein
MSIKLKLLWSIPYAVLLLGLALAGQGPVGQSEAPNPPDPPAKSAAANDR